MENEIGELVYYSPALNTIVIVEASIDFLIALVYVNNKDERLIVLGGL